MPRVLIPSSLTDVALPRHGTEHVATLAGATMGTTWCVKLVSEGASSLDRVRAGIQAALDLVIAQMSTWEPSSDLSRFNAAPSATWHALPEACFDVVDFALRLARETAGAYDPTIGPLVDLWGFGPAPRRSAPPSVEDIAAAHARTGWARVALDPKTRRAYQPGGVSVDLSSIAKGYAVDLVASALEGEGIDRYLIEIGGELRGRGTKPDGGPWWVALERPTDAVADARADTLVALHGLSVATSGDYRRYFEDGGTRYSHTIDPRTGRPVDHRLAAVTVLHGECMVADALATALTVLGAEDGLEWARRRDVAALFVERTAEGLDERLTPALAVMLE